eukprot:4176148-Alexandrium_andersonii.AAC.1
MSCTHACAEPPSPHRRYTRAPTHRPSLPQASPRGNKNEVPTLGGLVCILIDACSAVHLRVPVHQPAC